MAATSRHVLAGYLIVVFVGNRSDADHCWHRTGSAGSGAGRRMRCRECDEKGRAVIPIRWDSPMVVAADRGDASRSVAPATLNVSTVPGLRISALALLR